MAKKGRDQGRRVKHVRRANVKKRPGKPARSNAVFERLGAGIVPLSISLLLLVCIGIVVAMAYGSMTRSEFFSLDAVKVSGTERASSADIEKIIKANAEPTGVWNADLLEIKQKIERVTFVKTAAVSRSLPNGINAAVVERIPVAIVRMAGGDHYADEEGVILAPADVNEKRIPFAMLGWDDAKSEKAQKENLERLKTYRKMLSEWKDYDLASRVKLVDLTDLREPKATLEDSGLPVTIMLGRDNFGKQLADGIKAIVGKGNMFEGVDLIGPNMVLVPRKQQQR